jgi:hypothetical protein
MPTSSSRSSMIRLEVTCGAASQLACIRHTDGEEALAIQLGDAIDHLHDHFALTARDREVVLGVLVVDCRARLADLRASLRADHLTVRSLLG